MPSMARPTLLAGLLRRIDNFGLDTFGGRLAFQKTVYLLQAFGIYLGYRFNWYLRGPYSPSLTRDGFGLGEVLPAYPAVRFVQDDTERRFEEFLRFIEPHKNDQKWLEVAASAHFLARVLNEADRDAVFAKVAAKQGNVSRTYFDNTWQELVEVGLLWP